MCVAAMAMAMAMAMEQKSRAGRVAGIEMSMGGSGLQTEGSGPPGSVCSSLVGSVGPRQVPSDGDGDGAVAAVGELSRALLV